MNWHTVGSPKINDVREWFESLSFNEKCEISVKYFGHRNSNNITDKELKNCFKTETEK